MVKSLVKKLNSGGQATVEYILLIVIVVAIALAVKGPLGERLGRFSGSMVGQDGYYACLMERGYLPEDPRATECARHMDKAIVTLEEAGGSGGIGGGAEGEGSHSGGSSVLGDRSGSGGSSDGAGGENGSDEGSESFDGSEDSSGSEDFSGSGDRSASPISHRAGGSSAGGGGSGSLSGSGLNPGSFPARLDNGVSAGDTEESDEDEDSQSDREGRGQVSSGFDTENAGYKQKKFRAPSSKDEGYLGERYYDDESPTKKVFKAKDPGGSGLGAGSGGEEDTKKTKAIETTKKAKNEGPGKTKKMNFLAFIKYFLIGALIILLLAIIFSQVMEYQSRD